ncbi:MAG: 2,4-dihydroxyhept-2-ene-1,7-dioic acid aldolase [Desulfovibrio sp.]|nr:2,4-dihydroxyhept-2-ene-1,7-dioic acid aldolase [Desulfovibrio sp.]
MTTFRGLKETLQHKQLTIGSWLSWGFSPVTEIMAKAGFDWLVIDLEHTAIDYAQAHQMIQTIDLAGCVPLVRVGDNDPLIIKRVLDSGAHGIVVPMINSADEARRAVDAAYYPPKGTRGVGLSRAQGYGVDFQGYRERAMEQTVVIVQIEHIVGVEHLEDILSVQGVDGFIIGPYDLSGSLGQPGNFEHPDVLAALAHVEKVMHASPKAGGYHVVQTNRTMLQQRMDQGYTFIAYGDDMVIFAERMHEEGQFLKALNEK